MNRHRCEVQSLAAVPVSREQELIAGQCLALDDQAYVVSKVLERGEDAGLGMEVHKVKAPAAVLASTVLAHEPVEPSFKSARQLEISAIDRQHERVVDDAGIEPIRQDQFES